MSLSGLLSRIASRIPEPRFTRPRNRKLWEWMNVNAIGKRVLNLGSGVGRFDSLLSTEVRSINLDIDPRKPRVTVVADAHFLPFKDRTFDIVYSIAVLEHVERPWKVAEEIARVLRPGGHVVLELPFLNVIHDEHDYFRFTDKGIRSLFHETEFEMVFEQVGSGGGSFLPVFLLEYFRQFIPTHGLKAAWTIAMGHAFSLLKHLDALIDSSEELRRTANSFTYIGRRR